MRVLQHASRRAAPRPEACFGALRRRRTGPNTHLYRGFASAVDLSFGQPLHETHPHLLRYGEITPGISAVEYAERRLRLARSLPPNSVAVLAASDIKTRSGAVFYKFHQEPNFFYLTGFNEPTAVAVIEKKGDAPTDHAFWLFVRPKDTLKEKWEGSRSGIQAAQDVFNADEAEDIGAISKILPDILNDATHILTNIVAQPRDRSTFMKMISGAAPAMSPQRLLELLGARNVKPLTPYVNELRAFKSDAEIVNMRTAGRASARGFTDSMRQEWHTELDLEGFLEYQFKKNGCEQSAYVPVIAGGEVAGIL